MVEGDLEAAQAVTHQTVVKITKSGAMKKKSVLVPLLPLTQPEKDDGGAAFCPADPGHVGSVYENCSPGPDADADADADVVTSAQSRAKPSKVDNIAAAYGETLIWLY